MTYTPWEESEGSGSGSTVGVGLTDSEALKEFLEAPGLVWLMERSKSIFRLFRALVTQRIDKEQWKEDFDERTGNLASWPGRESVDGLRSEHLSPDCKSGGFWVSQ